MYNPCLGPEVCHSREVRLHKRGEIGLLVFIFEVMIDEPAGLPQYRCDWTVT